jgi:hypothetical protein
MIDVFLQLKILTATLVKALFGASACAPTDAFHGLFFFDKVAITFFMRTA